MNNRFTKIAQAPPPPPAAPAGVVPPMAPPPMPGLAPPPMGMGTPPPVQPMSSPPEREEISAALDTLGKILYDVDVTELIENNVAEKTDDLAMKIWMEYGGNEMGQADPNKTGLRSEDAIPVPNDKTEREKTEDKLWERLPKGKTIADITSLDEMVQVMNGLAVGTIKKTTQENAPAAPPGGAPPMMASTRAIVRLAKIMDEFGYFADADYLDAVLNKK